MLKHAVHRLVSMCPTPVFNMFKDTLTIDELNTRQPVPPTAVHLYPQARTFCDTIAFLGDA